MKEGGGRCECECAGGAPRAEGVLTPWTPPPLEGSPLPSLFPRASPSSAFPLPPVQLRPTPVQLQPLLVPLWKGVPRPLPAAVAGRPTGVGVGRWGLAGSGFRIPLRPQAAAFRPQGLRSLGVGRALKEGGGGERCRPALRAQSIECPYTPRRVPSGARRRRRPEPCAGARRAKLKLEADLTQK